MTRAVLVWLGPARICLAPAFLAGHRGISSGIGGLFNSRLSGGRRQRDKERERGRESFVSPTCHVPSFQAFSIMPACVYPRRITILIRGQYSGSTFVRQFHYAVLINPKFLVRGQVDVSRNATRKQRENSSDCCYYFDSFKRETTKVMEYHFDSHF